MNAHVAAPASADTRTAPRKRACLNVTSHLEARFGGIAASLPEFCRATAGDYESQLLGVCAPEETLPCADGFHLTSLPGGRLRWAFGRGLQKRMAERATAVDIVHVHGIWEEHCAQACAAARRAARPYIVSAHGMLESWGLRQKSWKKQPYLALVERRNMASASCLRALTRHEVDDYRRAGIRTPAVVVPNGVALPDAKITAAEFLAAFPDLRSRRVVLFLGRLHRKKGLDLLCRAWARIAKRFADAVLFLAGPDFDGTEARLRALVDDCGITSCVIFGGMLTGTLKWSALAAAEIFVLLSHSEGFSVATLEALGMGVPVAITPQCWFPEIQRAGCGWIVSPGIDAAAEVLSESLRMPFSTRGAMQDQARKLVERDYAWPVVGRRMQQVYDWILDGTRPPSLEVFE